MKLFFIRCKKVWVLLLMITAFGTTLSGQIAVRGRVISSEDQAGLPGVNVIVKGTTLGVTTGADGSFNISLKKKEDILVFSFIGFNTMEVPVGDKTTIEIKMVPQINELEMVVVMGYSNKKRNEITSAVTTVSSDKLMDVTSNDIGTMLQGKVAGIQVINGSGTPGATPDIRIRGSSSFSAPNQGPLYVVDGIIGGNFDPNDVETITVMKDAGATALYGSQANG